MVGNWITDELMRLDGEISAAKDRRWREWLIGLRGRLCALGRLRWA